jgi:hypothetical protein
MLHRMQNNVNQEVFDTVHTYICHVYRFIRFDVYYFRNLVGKFQLHRYTHFHSVSLIRTYHRDK